VCGLPCEVGLRINKGRQKAVNSVEYSLFTYPGRQVIHSHSFGWRQEGLMQRLLPLYKSPGEVSNPWGLPQCLAFLYGRSRLSPCILSDYILLCWCHLLLSLLLGPPRRRPGDATVTREAVPRCSGLLWAPVFSKTFTTEAPLFFK